MMAGGSYEMIDDAGDLKGKVSRCNTAAGVISGGRPNNVPWLSGFVLIAYVYSDRLS